jgi:hypothetical protein
MSAKTKLAITAFFAICGMGLFTALAGGIQWGTYAAGEASAVTFIIGFLVFAAIKSEL